MSDGVDERHSPHRLDRRHYGCHRQMPEKLLNLLHQQGDPLFGIFNGVDVVLQDDLLSGMGEAHSC